MSRTDVHRPWKVQIADPTNRHLLYRYAAWPWQTGLTSFRNLGCGCHQCTGQDGRKQERRRERTRWRGQRQRMRTVLVEDRDTIDVPARRPGW